MGGNSPLSLFIAQGKNRIAGTTKFEGTHLLKILALEVKLSAGQLIQGAASKQGGVMGERRDSSGGIANGFKVRTVHGSSLGLGINIAQVPSTFF
jgi:hypothetical protein